MTVGVKLLGNLLACSLFKSSGFFSNSGPGGSAAKACAMHRMSGTGGGLTDDNATDGEGVAGVSREVVSVEATTGDDVSLEGDPEVVVIDKKAGTDKDAATLGWYHPHLLTFFVCASPLARERSAWSIVAEAVHPAEVPKRSLEPFDVNVVKEVASKNQFGNVVTPNSKESSSKSKKNAQMAAANMATEACIAAEKAATAAEKAANAVESFTTRRNKRDLCDALQETLANESDDEEKVKLKARLKKARSDYLALLENE